MGKHYNYVWFCTDQQRFDTISALGNKCIRTPNIDRLIDEGVAFSNAYAQSPLCTPSRSSFLTGRYPRTTRSIINGNLSFSKDEKLITKILAEKGYECGLVGKLHLTAAYKRMEERTDDGYTYFQWSHMPINNWEPGVNNYQDWLIEKGVDWDTEYVSPCPNWPPKNGYPLPEKIKGMTEENHQTTWCVEKALEFIKQQSSNKPWCVSINCYAPHPPFDPPESYKQRLNIEDMPLPTFKEGELDNKPSWQRDCYLNGSQKGMVRDTIGMTDMEKKEVTRDYYANIELIDAQFGRLIDYLEETGQRENTIIIFMSDHGEMLGDHGIYWKGGYFYEGLIHVPLIMSCPGLIKEGLVSNALVELVDLAPTLLELSGLPVPEYMQGTSFAPILTGKADPAYHKDVVYAEYYFGANMLHEVYGTMLFDGRYKVVVYHNTEMGELYDLQNDPNEFENLWENKDLFELRYYLVKKCFDHSVMCNIDKILGRRSNY